MGKPEEMRPFERPRRRLEYNIKMYLTEVGCKNNFECYAALLGNRIAFGHLGAITAALQRLSLLKRHHSIW